MSKKTRNDITSAINSNLFTNNNKEILASMIREVFEDVRDSFFNLKDDELRTVKFNENKTLQEYMDTVVGAIPLWGATGVFDIGGVSKDIDGHSDNGIVSSSTHNRLSGHNSSVTINFSKSIANKRLSVSVWLDGNASLDIHNDICTPIIRRVNSTQIEVGLREVAPHTQKIRLEILAFKPVV